MDLYALSQNYSVKVLHESARRSKTACLRENMLSFHDLHCSALWGIFSKTDKPALENNMFRRL
jgi:hypothetical protein